MSHMPSGTVTFLFTDIEGSTRKWQNWPHKMKRALKQHDDILQQTIEEHNGYVFKTVGDAFCAAFQTALDCINGALAAQIKINEVKWDLPEAFRVRMAIHTGEAVERNKDYYGPVLNRVARLEGITYGGQILLSLVTAELVRDMLPEPMGLLSMGKHRLKDLTRPEEVFQLLHPDIPEDFEPLKSLDSHRHNLAIQPSALIGRDEELKQIRQYLLSSSSRIVTITGPGGMGKTRIAVQAGAEMIDAFSGGVYFVDLTAIKREESFYRLICTTLSVDESGSDDLLENLVEYLNVKECLLILDNFEHIMDASIKAAELISHCPDLHYLVTSREALHLRGEQIYHLPPLSTPSDPEESRVKKLNQFDAFRLFIDRALEVDSDFEVNNINAPYIAQICSELDGIPLAIELAAARITTLSPRALLKRLNHRLDILTFGASDLPERHKTIRSTIAWSYELLEEQGRKLFSGLSLFQSGFDLDSAETVCPVIKGSTLDELEHLVEKNLIVKKNLPDGEPWFYLLETIHEYAMDIFEEREDKEKIRDKYCSYFIDLAGEGSKGLACEQQKVWMDRLTGQHDNLLHVLQILDDSGETDKLIAAVESLWHFWEISGFFHDGIKWCEKAIQMNHSVGNTIGLGALLIGRGDFHRALEILNNTDSDSLLLRYYLAWALFRLGELKESEDIFLQVEIEAERNLDKKLEARTIIGLSMVDWKTGNLDSAITRLSKALTLLKYCGDPRIIGQAANNMGIIYYQKGNFKKAEKYFKDALPIFKAISNRSEIQKLLNNLGYLNLFLQNYTLSLRYYRELSHISSDDTFFMGTAYLGMASAEIKLKKTGSARHKCMKAMEWLTPERFPGDYGIALRIMGDISREELKPGEARKFYEEAIPLLKENDESDDLQMAEEALGSL